jgi:hypothetical protein
MTAALTKRRVMTSHSFSRHLPSVPPNRIGWMVLALIACVYVAAFCFHPVGTAWSTAAFLIFQYWGSRSINRSLRALAVDRSGDPLCTFARSLNMRAVDSWVVRAVFDELQGRFGKSMRPFPIRASDRIGEDLRVLPEDVDELAVVVAHRAGYSMASCENNPLYGRVVTVGDLVAFFNHQQRTRGC